MSDLRSVSYEDAIVITPSDTTVFAKAYAAFMCTVAGTVQITTLRNRTAVIPVLAGIIYPIPFFRLWNANTAAGTITGLCALPYLGAN